ncbi:MAG TPA: ABC transporter permease [Candidatus Limnocylindrales bacterium]|nr:ABC transporter permease [Candidatus Limnocylindrales bacterium]
MTAIPTTPATPADLPDATNPKGTAPMYALRDTWLIFHRSLILTLRQPVWIIFGLMQPILYLVLFGPLLDASVKAANVGQNAFNWFIPGLLIQMAVFGGAFVGFGLIAELRAGVVERMRVTPMSRIAMLFGRSLRDVVIMVVQAMLIMVVAIPFGLRIDFAGAVVTIALLILIGLALAPLSYTAALVLKSEDALAPVVNGVALPLLLLSGILLPLALAPDWLKFLSTLNPLTHAADAARALFNGDWANPEIAIGAVVMGALAILAVWLASRAFNRAVA